jgi:hypothetical protein
MRYSPDGETDFKNKGQPSARINGLIYRQTGKILSESTYLKFYKKSVELEGT